MSNSQERDSLEDIAIIGMAGRFPGAGSIDEFWQNLRNGVESISFFSEEELRSSGVSLASIENPKYVRAKAVLADVEEFDAAFFGFSPREAEILDPQQRLFLECAWQACESAGYDPEIYKGLVGVFAGAGISTYLFNLYSNRDLVELVGSLQTMIGNDKDHLPTRVSYKLNLRGPSVAVQTACSTSLVAVHMACQSLLDYQCDMALAGGVSISLPQKVGYIYEEGGITSPDGHCRAFDSKAKGTVGGSGVGIVILKRLNEALEDGDYIHALIKGSAINNDGSLKVGYTAPSVEGQSAVIALAQELAGVAPETVTYIEGHGTATPVGDPIEVAALERVFRASTSNRRFCALGSVKTNIGHLDAAAGVAGLIKTALALKHRLLPPSLHFEEGNSAIDFANSPFYVNNKPSEWKANGTPRRAGVNSFGIGGTNAHVVLEEAPPSEPSGDSRAWQLLTLSAKTGTALDAATANLAAYLKQKEEVDLADVAYTLQVGRRRYQHKRVVVCRDRQEAISALEGRDPQRVYTSALEGRNSPLIFMFSGQGSQYVNMGLELYEDEPSFREQIDHCSQLLAPHLEFDLRDVLYPKGRTSEGASDLLNQTYITQPALFVVEYALAKLWMRWGIRPSAMIGHSIGEYVAACLAGVFSLQDALTLVAARGRAMQALPPGAMLAVSLPEKELSELIGSRLSLAAVNAPALCVASGEAAAIKALEEELSDRGVDCRRLHTSHAFHSEMMSPILDTFAQQVSKVRLNEPEIPFVSNLTGKWIRPGEATDVTYWTRHLRETVRFADGITELLQEGDGILLEVGPGQTLSTILRLNTAGLTDPVVVSSLRHPHEKRSDLEFILKSLGQLWLAAAEVDWPGLYSRGRRHRLPLPTYPFERQRYWVEPKRRPSESVAAVARTEEQAAITQQESVGSDMPPSRDAQGLRSNRSKHPRPALLNDYVASRDEVEQTVAELWQDLLGIEPVGVFDNFLELGGHSLLATQMIARVRESFQIDLPLRSAFETPTVAGLAAAVVKQKAGQRAEEKLDVQLPVIIPDPQNRHEPFPLTDVQHAYWIGRSGLFELGDVATHSYMETESAWIDLKRFNEALRRLIARHAMLRAIILPDGQQQILQSVPPYEVKVLDMRGLDDQEAASMTNGLREEMSHQILRTDQWPIFDIRASLLDEKRIRFHFSFDALIGDAMSLIILGREFFSLYQDPDAQLPPLDISFRDYVLADIALKESPAYERAKQYWWGRLDTLPPAPDLPLANKPGSLEKPRFSRRTTRLPKESWSRLKAAAARAGVTPSGVLLAAYAETLGAWSKSPRLTINLTLFNRLPLHPQVNQIVGDFTSLTLLEADTSAGDTFEDRARQIQTQLWDDLDHRYVGGVQVLREMARRQGAAARVTMPVVFTSTLNLDSGAQNDSAQLQEDPAQEADDQMYGISQTPQVWLDHQVQERGGALMLNWDAVEDLFPEGLLDSMFAAYSEFVRRLADDEGSWQERARTLLPDEQLRQRSAVNATEAPISGELLHNLFAAQVAKEASHPAVIAPDITLSYEDLYRRSNQVGHLLRSLGVRPNKLVAVVMEKGWEQVVAVLGVLASGAAYLPISPKLPKERLSYLLEHGEVEVALTQPWLDDALEWPDRIQRVCIEKQVIEGVEDGPLDAVQGPDDLAYVIFTSGSTGLPKGVMIDHRGAVNTILDMNSRFRVGASDRVLALSSLSFDLSVYDIFGMLAAGATIIMPASSPVPDPAHWAELIALERVTVWNSVPALMQMLVEQVEVRPKALPDSLRLVLMSGDWIPVNLPERIRALSEDVELISLGGATEASIWSILYPIDHVEAGWKSIPYGRPMVNQTFHVLDHSLQPCPTWVPGQLYIGGIGLAKGYWRDKEKTDAQFISHARTGERLYKTGDLGRYLPSGDIEFLGREDFQVKIQGYRIELGEIESALAQHAAVRDAVVTATGPRQGDKRLAAYVVAAQDEPLTANDLRGFLKGKLPDYMIPSSFVMLDRFPLTSNGKVDRRALPAPDIASHDSQNVFTPPSTQVEETVAAIWADVLKSDRISVDANFFEMGGDSLMATKIFALVQKTFEVEISVRQLLEEPTIAGMAAVIEDTIIDELMKSPDGEGETPQ